MLRTICCFLALAQVSLAGSEWKAGVAKIDITPRNSVWMAGYGNRDRPSEGTAQPLLAKALALEDPSGGRLVIVTSDLLGFVREITEPLAERVREQHGLGRERFVVTSSHTHAGPAVRASLKIMYALTPEQAAAVEDYTRFLQQQVLQVVGEAIKNLSPAHLSFHRGQAGFAMNRREPSDGGIKLGVNPGGPVDHEVPVMRVTSPEGKTRALLFSYACHNTTLGGDFYQFHGDYAGYAQEAIEKAEPGAIALFMMGCGGDANPQPRSKLEHAQAHGNELAQAVAEAARRQGRPVKGRLSAAFERFSLPLAAPPSRAEFEARAKDENRFIQRHAEYHLALLDRGPLPAEHSYPLQVVQFGDTVTLVALAGEVVVDYALRLKKELGAEITWPVAYANDVFAYIPSKRVLAEGGYEADRSMIYYGLPGPWAPEIEEILIKKVHQLVGQVRGESR